MASDRWRQIEELCHATLGRPVGERAAFLETACEGDGLLRREVESLLAQESGAERFMSVPAAALADSALRDHPRNRLVGQRLGPYTIRALLGVGGMGEVYRAHDDTLGRDVAIKVLPLAFTADPERRARFEREARTLATLNHPHIGAIYGVEEADGVRGLVLELVEGDTLADRIAASARASGLPMTEVFVIARQIVDALEAAHEKGIVHRDLKPANIKITPAGIVKVLDFGLAKIVGGEGTAPDLTLAPPTRADGRREGAVIGTAAYMSPEQARGQGVDKRGDIWAFGCVLYEMLTGRVAFPGDTISDTIAKILEHEPDWSVLPMGTSPAVRRILLRCLAKDPKQRLRDIGDVRIEIDAIDDGALAANVVRDAPASRRWVPWVTAAAVAAGAIVWEARRGTPAPENPLANARFSRFTHWEGTETAAEISPDGRFVVFLADRAGQFDLWVSQVGTGLFRNLTADIPSLGKPTGILRQFGFYGDGAEIWFSPPEARAQKPSQNAPRTEPKMLLPLMGGTSHTFLGEGAETPSWSPDGSRLVYVINGGGDPLFVADGTGADARKLLDDRPQEGVHNHNPIWSPDGEWIYFVQGSDPTAKMDVWRVHPNGGSLERMTELNVAPNFLALLDSRTLLYVAPADDGSGPWLWALDIERKVTRRVVSGLEQYTWVSASRDGRRVVATVSNPTATLWRVPLLDRSAVETDVQPYPVPTVRALAPRFSGTSLFYLSAQGTGDGLWRVQGEQASEVWRGAAVALSDPASVSRDGERVAVVVRREGKRHLTVMSADGTNVRTLAPSIDIQGAAGQSSADWSSDGAWIVAGGRDASGAALFKIPVDGAAPVRLVAGQASNPIWSPDGSLIVYAGPLVAGQTALRGVRPDGAPIDLPHVRVRQGGYRFLPDGKHVVFLPVNASLDFWLLDLETRTTRQLTRLDDRGEIRTFDITPDGKHIVFDRSRDNSDIVLIDIPR